MDGDARRGGNALNGKPLGARPPKDQIEILAFEATLTPRSQRRRRRVIGVAHRLRIMGSLALSLCHLAAGRIDAVCSLKPSRSVDVAAAQLLVRECGLAIENFDGDSFAELRSRPRRSRIAAAGTFNAVGRSGNAPSS